nr:hypothetical protein BaRGS_014401 [Batillaria attramentaria]
MAESFVVVCGQSASTDLSYPPSEYEIHERFVLVCSDFKNLNDLWGNFTFFSFSSAQYYVSMALSLTSVVSLLASLVAFCMISELQTLAGHMTAALAASLAIGQLLLLLDFIRHRLLCSVIAAVCHFCWLAAFSWMSALAMMMARTFNGSLAAGAGNHSPKHQKKVFRKYSAVGWGLPAVMVIALYTVDNVPGVGGVVSLSLMSPS